MDYEKMVRDMLNSNITPEKIYQTALDELQKIQATKEKDARLARERDALIEAVVNYMPDAFPSINFGTPTELANTVESVLAQVEKDGPELVKLYIKLNDIDARYGADVKRAHPTAEEKVKNLDDVFNAFFKKHNLF